jgi:hypothetical protein
MSDELSLAERKVVRCLDGLHYSFEILEWSYSRLWANCALIPREKDRAIEALTCCWVFIDALHRVRGIAQSAPRISKKNSEVRAFLATTELAEEFRHYIQHLRNQLNKWPADVFPVWGSMTWVDPDDESTSHTLVLGALSGSVRVTPSSYDCAEGQWASKVSLGLLGKTFCFDPMFVAAQRFRQFVIPQLELNVPGINRGLSSPMIFSTTMARIDGQLVRKVRTSVPYRVSFLERD